MQLPRELSIDLMKLWEAQQNCHIRFREDRFQIMFDFVGESLGSALNAMDIACGPGSLTRRLLERFPDSRVKSVDFDPVLLGIGQQALSGISEKIEWVEGDLRKDDWFKNIDEGTLDCAMSTTALHWLDSKSLENLYGNIYRLLRKGGIFMNGDHMISEERQKDITQVVHEANEKWSASAFRETNALNWDEWWAHVAKFQEFGDLLRERMNRYSNPDNHNQMVSLNSHINYLEKAGFKLIDVIWQYSNDRILVAVK